MLPLVSCPVSQCLGVCPPDLCGWRYLSRVWVEGHRRRCPPDGLRSSMRLAIPSGSTEVSPAILTPLDHLCARLYLPLPLPLPFPVQPYLYRYHPYQRESIFVVTPIALSTSVPPGPGPVDLLNDIRAPFHVHPSHSVVMLVVRSHPNPKREFCSGNRSVGETAPRAQTTGPGYRAKIKNKKY